MNNQPNNLNNLAKISACILVKNAQSTLKECLESVREFGEIILLDNGSTDSTLEIAREFNETYGNLRIESSEFIGFGALKNLAISYARNEWIFSLDSDEVLEKSALEQIKALNLEPHCIYALSRKNLYNGEWIQACGWSPDFVWRIFNKNFTRFNENIVHESVILPPNAHKIRLQGYIKHYACSGIPQLLDKLQRYTTLYAEQHAKSHKRTSMTKAATHFVWGFIKNYFFRNGIFYGYKGFVISLCNALGSFFKHAKLYEAQILHNRATPDNTTLIITTYNQKERLALVLDSVRALNPLPKEVLIADDGSKPDTREVIESYAQDFPCTLRHIWHEDKGFRLSAIRNEAIKSATGEYIIIIDGDIIVDSRFVAEHLKFAKRGAFLQGSRVILNESETTQILESRNYRLAFNSRSFKATHCNILARLIYKFSKTTANIFRKKELIKGIRGCNMSFFKRDCEAINGFNEEFIGWGREDSEFVARFLFNGGVLWRVKFNALAYHLYHPENPRAMLESNHNIYIYIYAKLKQLGQKWVCKRDKNQKSRESRGESSQDSHKKRIIITLKDITEKGGGERVGVNLANAFSQNLGYEVRIISFFRSFESPCYALDSRISCTYLCNRPAKSKNPLISLLNKTILRVILCLKTHKLAKQTNADIVLANDGWFVPLFVKKSRGLTKFVRLWHINAPKRARKKLRRFDCLAILSSRELSLWQTYHHNITVIPNFLPEIPSESTNHSQKVVLSIGRMDKGDQKGFLRLIDIWKIVQDKINNVSLQTSENNEAIQTNSSLQSDSMRLDSSLRESASADSWQSKSHEFNIDDCFVSLTNPVDCHEKSNDLSHNDTPPCHSERSTLCEAKNPKETQNKNANLQNKQNKVSLEHFLDSSATLLPQNDEIIDCHDFATAESRNDSIDSQNLSQWKLIIVGDGIMKSEIESKIHALNLQDSIILKPFTKDIESEYLSASVYAMSSLWEGFPMVLIEASSYALPCIAFDVATGPSDIIEHNQNGYLINDNDLESYAKHLIMLMSDESMRERFGSEAKRLVGERFSKEVVMEKWERLFKHIAKI